MGVLEDAIREHLELKRKHGVSDEEVRRQEDEALGPARRETPVAEAADSEPAAETALLDPDHVPEEAVPEEPVAVDGSAVEEEAVEEAPVEEAPVEPAAPLVEPVPPSADFEEEAPPEQDALSFEERPRRDLDFD